MNIPVYLDNQATTRVDRRVIDAMTPLMDEVYGNASSTQHEFGWRAEAAVEQARRRVAALVGLPGPAAGIAPVRRGALRFMRPAPALLLRPLGRRRPRLGPKPKPPSNTRGSEASVSTSS